MFGGRIGELLAGASGSLGVRIGGTAFAFTVHVALGRVLGPADYGTYVFAMTVAGLLSVLARGGLDTLQIRLVAEFQARGEWALARQLVRWSFRVAGGLALALALAGALLYWATGDRSLLATPSISIAAGAIGVLSTLAAIRQGALKGLRRIVSAEAPDAIARPCLMLAGIGGAMVFGMQIDAGVALWLQVVAVSGAMVIGSVLLQRALAAHGPVEVPARARHAEWIRTAAPMMIFGVAIYGQGQIDVLIVGSLLAAHETGAFAAATRIAMFATFALLSVTAIASPLFARAWAQRDLDLLCTLSRACCLLIAAGTICAAALMAYAAPLVLALFGPDFENSRDALSILLGGYALAACAGSGTAGILLSMTGHQRQLAIVTLVIVAASVPVVVVAIGIAGIEGAAVGTAFSAFTLAGATNWMVHRTLGFAVFPDPVAFVRAMYERSP